MRIEKAELVQSVRNAKMKGVTYRAISNTFRIAPSTAYKYCEKNVLSEPVFYPIRRVRLSRALKIVQLLRDKYKMTFGSALRFINSLGIRMTKDTLKRLYYAKPKAG